MRKVVNDAVCLRELGDLSLSTVPILNPTTWSPGAWNTNLKINVSFCSPAKPPSVSDLSGSRMGIITHRRYSRRTSKARPPHYGEQFTNFEYVQEADMLLSLKESQDSISTFSRHLNFYGSHRFSQLSGVFPVAHAATQHLSQQLYNFSVTQDSLRVNRISFVLGVSFLNLRL